MSNITTQRSERDPTVLRCYALTVIAVIFNILACITSSPISSQFLSTISAVLTAILISHIINMVLRER